VKTLAELFEEVESQDRADLVLARSGDHFSPVSAREWGSWVRRCADGLAGLGIGRGDRVGLICSNRPEWHVIDFACHLRGAVLVPIYSTLTSEQVRFIFADSGCKVVFAEGPEQLGKVASVRQKLRALETVVLVPLRDDPAEASQTPSSGTEQAGGGATTDFGAFLEGAPEADAHAGPEGAESLATIIYTSGTTGNPKGVMLTHANLISNFMAVLENLSHNESDRALSILPLCHIFQRIVDYTFFYVGAQIAYGTPKLLAEEYLLVRPTVVAGVPRLFERFRAAVFEQVSAGSAVKQKIFNWAERVGLRNAESELLDKPFGAFDRLQYAIADRLVLRSVREGAGGRIRHFVSGGAALDPSLNWWFSAMGLTVLQGYGLTETSPVISVNPRGSNRIGTVGRPIPGVEVKIAADGEIFTRGPHVMRGYWNDPQATAAVIVDGWLRTGDIGALDDDGYLRVTDRKKDLLVTSTGKNVAPQPLENALAQCRYIEQIAVVGDGRRFIAALIVPDLVMLARWAEGRGKGTDAGALCVDVDVAELMQIAIDALQADFAVFEQVRTFRLLPTPFSVAEGTLTPTFKVVRKVVEEKYTALIEEMYREG